MAVRPDAPGLAHHDAAGRDPLRADDQPKGRFALEAETFLFPGESQAGFGLLLGGKDLSKRPARATSRS